MASCFFHGQTAEDGGGLTRAAGKPRIEARTSLEGKWELLAEIKDYPASTAQDPAGLTGGERFVCDLDKPAKVYAVRVFGVPSCGNNPAQGWSSCLELQAFAPRKLNY